MCRTTKVTMSSPKSHEHPCHASRSTIPMSLILLRHRHPSTKSTNPRRSPNGCRHSATPLAENAFHTDRKRCRLHDGVNCEFSELLLQPVSWSPTPKEACHRSNLLALSCVEDPSRTRQEFESYLDGSDYTNINIPPTVMFQAKISQIIPYGLP